MPSVTYPRRVGGVRYKTREEHQGAACQRAYDDDCAPACCGDCGLFSDEVQRIVRCVRCEELVCGRCLKAHEAACEGGGGWRVDEAPRTALTSPPDSPGDRPGGGGVGEQR